jgi:uncharacterized protein
MEYRGRTRLLILQGSPFCNINCDYCYLPARADRSRMSFETLAATIRWVVREELAAENLTVVWHAGEPLVLPVSWYRDAAAVIRRETPGNRGFPHSIQTNGMLINDEWCDFFLDEHVNVGVSIDGPAWLHDARRRTRSGKGTHEAALRGISILQRRGIPFHVICVITESTLSAADELMTFFLSRNITRIGFNIEEIEGVNPRSSLAVGDVDKRFREFFGTLIDCALRHTTPVDLREVEMMGRTLTDPLYGLRTGNSLNTPFETVTISWAGDIFTFSPELAGLHTDQYTSFAVGNVKDACLSDIVISERFRTLASEIRVGVQHCKSSCEYFNVCGGGAPVNKLYELGRFDGTETLYCRLTQKAITDAVLSRSRLN